MSKKHSATRKNISVYLLVPPSNSNLDYVLESKFYIVHVWTEKPTNIPENILLLTPDTGKRMTSS